MKKKLLLCLVMLLLTSMSFVFANETMLISANQEEGTEFSDVAEDFWAKGSIERWQKDEVINGYEDNSYKPSNAITRAEFIAMISRIFVPTEKADLSKFKDVDAEAWYYEYMAKAVEMGIIKGYSETELAPNAYITRQEAITIISRILEVNDDKEIEIKDYEDKDDIAEWAEDSIALMTSFGFVNGYENNTIKPNVNITRAEVATILDRTFSVVIRKAGTYNLGEVNGNVVVVAENVIIENSNISGGVCLGANLKEDSVTLSNTEAKQGVTTIEDVKVNNGVVDSEAKDDEKEEETPSSGDKEEEKEDKPTSTGGGSGSSSTKKSHVITISIEDGKYSFTKSTTSKIALKDYLTIKSGDDTLVEKFTITETDLKANVKTIIDSLDTATVKATFNDYKSNEEVRAIAIKVIVAINRAENDTDAENKYDNIEPRDIKALAKEAVDVLTFDELVKLANVVIK